MQSKKYIKMIYKTIRDFLFFIYYVLTSINFSFILFRKDFPYEKTYTKYSYSIPNIYLPSSIHTLLVISISTKRWFAFVVQNTMFLGNVFNRINYFKNILFSTWILIPLKILDGPFQSYILDASGRSSVMRCLHCRFRVISASYRLRQ